MELSDGFGYGEDHIYAYNYTPLGVSELHELYDEFSQACPWKVSFEIPQMVHETIQFGAQLSDPFKYLLELMVPLECLPLFVMLHPLATLVSAADLALRRFCL